MKKSNDWQAHVNVDGDFELPIYLFRTINDLMKTSLDFGTLLCDDPAKLRAYKEQLKSTFKQRWYDLAQALEFFDLIVPCNCAKNEYCTQCGGSRYILNSALAPEHMREIAVVVGAGAKPDVLSRLEEGLSEILQDTNDMSKM